MIETVRPATAANARVVIFDFDGTLSVIRSGWLEDMVPLCVDQLRKTNSGETDAELAAVTEDFIWRLTGKETVYQMQALAEAVRERGGVPLEPLAYKKMYLDRLNARIKTRLEDLSSGRARQEQYAVPGAIALLESLSKKGLTLYLASGTDHVNVKQEAELLGVAPYFEDRIFGAHDDPHHFSKAMLVQQIVSEAGFRADELLVFGDGFVEIEEVKKVGGVAVGVASQEPECLAVDQQKRTRLVEVGADFIVPNYLEQDALMKALFTQPVLVER